MQFPSPWPVQNKGHPQPNCIARPENPFTVQVEIFIFQCIRASCRDRGYKIRFKIPCCYRRAEDKRYFEFRFIVSRKFTCESQIQFHGIQLVWQESKFKLLWVHIKLESNRLRLGRRCKHIVGNYFFTACHCRQKTLVVL